MTPAPTVATLQPRAIAIDLFKSYLVIGMVMAHTIALLYHDTGIPTSSLLHALVSVMNLISFSGFFFCFGYVNYKTYLNRPFTEVWKKLGKNALRLLIAYYISAFASGLLLSGPELGILRIFRILAFTEMPSYSEFLLAFFLVTLLTIVTFNSLKQAISAKWTLIVLIALSLASALIVPYKSIPGNYLGLLFGSRNFIGFPVVQYLCYFLTGILFAKNDIKLSWRILMISFLISLPFFLSVIVTKHLPDRFPPDILWISGAAFLLYLYYSFSIISEKWLSGFNWLLSIGRNTLLYLTLSNIFLFALSARINVGLSITPLGLGLTYLSIMFVIYYLSKQITVDKRA